LRFSASTAGTVLRRQGGRHKMIAPRLVVLLTFAKDPGTDAQVNFMWERI
jgi:hypothetical protein